eukprot:s3740_g1.t1
MFSPHDALIGLILRFVLGERCGRVHSFRDASRSGILAPADQGIVSAKSCTGFPTPEPQTSLQTASPGSILLKRRYQRYKIP